MLTQELKKKLQSDLFRHLDGIVTAPSLHALQTAGVLQYLLDHESSTLDNLAEKFEANPGYLNVALRVLASQGWLTQEIDNVEDVVSYSISELSPFAFSHVFLYDDVVHLLKISEHYHHRLFEIEPFRVLEKIFVKYMNNFGLTLSANPLENAVQQQMLKHVEGILVGPTIVRLGMNGMFHKYFMEASFKPDEYHRDPESFTKILDFLTFLGWFIKKRDTYQFTETGLYYAKRASAYGVTVSYVPTLRKLEDIIFGDPSVLRNTKPDEPEQHVDREMNVWGSGGAHSSYFKVIDEIIIEMFNRPLDEQPKGILDMGCGNGALLEHLFNVIEYRTLRGRHLDDHPLFLVGVDYNEAALKVSRANLINADIWAKVIWGDIGRPDLLAAELQDNYGIDINDLLNMRTFLDHNRIWEAPKKLQQHASTSTGAFAFRGARLSNNQVEDSLREHLEKWTPFLTRFGLVVIELHTVPPALVAQNIGRTPSTAYDATHGYSDQYILEVDVFQRVAKEAGLTSDERFFRKFPQTDLATITISLLRGET